MPGCHRLIHTITVYYVQLQLNRSSTIFISLHSILSLASRDLGNATIEDVDPIIQVINLCTSMVALYSRDQAQRYLQSFQLFIIPVD